jgi:hypothetical protein
VLVPAVVVIVAEALAGGVTLAGLTVHSGALTIVCGCTGATWQLRSTALLKPPSVPTVTVAKEVPPGSIAFSDSAGAWSVKLCCADAFAGRVRKAASPQSATIAARPAKTISLGFDSLDLDSLDLVTLDLDGLRFDDSNCDGSVLDHTKCGNRDFNMSRFRFK